MVPIDPPQAHGLLYIILFSASLLLPLQVGAYTEADTFRTRTKRIHTAAFVGSDAPAHRLKLIPRSFDEQPNNPYQRTTPGL